MWKKFAYFDRTSEYQLGGYGSWCGDFSGVNPVVLIALIVAGTFAGGDGWRLLSLLLIYLGYDVATIGSAFQYTLSDGSTGFGIP